MKLWKLMVYNTLHGIFEWIRSDWASYPVRFIIELIAWAISIGCSITMAVTAPNPPLLYMYPVWITGCVLYGWSAYTRRSFGMIANYALLVGIDMVGLVRILML
jgi:hypothetical protein